MFMELSGMKKVIELSILDRQMYRTIEHYLYLDLMSLDEYDKEKVQEEMMALVELSKAGFKGIDDCEVIGKGDKIVNP